jgi:hypothetical protein
MSGRISTGILEATPFSGDGALLMKARVLRSFLVSSAGIFVMFSGYLLSARLPMIQPAPTDTALSFGLQILVVVCAVLMDSLLLAIFLGCMATLIALVEYWRAWKVRHPRDRPIAYALSAAQTMTVALTSDDCQRRIREWGAIYPDVELNEIALSPPCMLLTVGGHGWWSGEQITITIHASDAGHSTVQMISESRNHWQLGDLGKNADHVRRISMYLTKSSA